MTGIVTSIGVREDAYDRAERLCHSRNIAVGRLNAAIDLIECAEREYEEAKSNYEFADHEYQLAVAALDRMHPDPAPAP